ncbi:related to multidrug resistance protein fnx1 [Rhynchosporium agropyri]|uniref:Related to multidrug resistance protein fnx1 n=1 Tax=Rhynchosporium agropyri TaxID=914238 RepID=A0A1E1KLD5_9HELO|nr:related to multidrug resistance protein fnx1 [Rhynchosporium agropyri]
MAGQDRDVEQDEQPAVGRHHNLIKSGLNTRPTISILASEPSGYIGVSKQTSLLSKHGGDPDHKGADSEIDSEEEEDRSGYEDEDDDEVLSVQAPGESLIAIVGLLMIGVFVSNADGSLVLASYGTISSEFGTLTDASWLTTSYSLASCAVQPITGKLSDIYGRKGVYYGIGQAMWQVIVGRVVAGLGAAGMTVIVSILITDVVPIVQVASWRSYVNVVATLGRSIGGPLGGFLADSIRWRWSFIGQGPIIGLAIILIALRLPSQTYPLASPLLGGSEGQHKITSKPQLSKIRRVDFVGAIFLALCIVSLLSALSLGGQNLPWSHPVVTGIGAGSIALGCTFVAWEKYGAFEPVFPPNLLIQRDVATSYAITALQAAAQLAMMFSIPLYFRATQNSSNTLAGTHLFPAVLGNTLGGLLSGFYISHTGRYKPISLLAALSSSLSYTLLILRWKGQCITWLDSFDIVPGGFGTGIAFSAAFIALTASVKRRNMAVATSGLYLCSGLGFVLGVAGASSVQITTLRTLLGKAFAGVDGAREITEEVISDISSIATLSPPIRKTVIDCYVKSIENSHCPYHILF